MTLVRFIFVIACICSVLIFTVHLRSQSRRVFYQCRATSVQLSKLKCDLARKQIEAGSLVNGIVIKESPRKVDETH